QRSDREARRDRAHRRTLPAVRSLSRARHWNRPSRLESCDPLDPVTLRRASRRALAARIAREAPRARSRGTTDRPQEGFAPMKTFASRWPLLATLILLCAGAASCTSPGEYQRQLADKDEQIRRLNEERAQLRAQVQGLKSSLDSAHGELS